MIFKRSLKLPGCVATIGNFDGIHLGHQTLIAKTLERAKEMQLPSVLILFEPHPKEFFAKENPPLRIQTLTDKIFKLQKMGLDFIYVIPFSKRIASQSPEVFIQEILQQDLHVKELIVGEDFRFGCNRAGSIETLQGAGITVNIVAAVGGQERVSSSKIRELLQQGNFNAASTLLGAPYCFTGRVTHGAKQGRLLGFPTLNLALSKKMPFAGVYAVKVHGLDNNTYLGVANIGRRPTVNPLLHPLLEVYVLDYNNDAYQKRVTIEFLYKVRDEKKFDSLDALKAQIASDIAFVKAEA